MNSCLQCKEVVPVLELIRYVRYQNPTAEEIMITPKEVTKAVKYLKNCKSRRYSTRSSYVCNVEAVSTALIMICRKNQWRKCIQDAMVAKNYRGITVLATTARNYSRIRIRMLSDKLELSKNVNIRGKNADLTV